MTKIVDEEITSVTLSLGKHLSSVVIQQLVNKIRDSMSLNGIIELIDESFHVI